MGVCVESRVKGEGSRGSMVTPGHPYVRGQHVPPPSVLRLNPYPLQSNGIRRFQCLLGSP